MAKTCIGYIRVSTERQQMDGNGCEQQRRSVCSYAVAAGLQITEWVIDDETGTTEDREGIQSLLGRAKSGVDHSRANGSPFTLVFDRMDRLGRTLLVCENLYKCFRDLGVELICVAQQLDDASPAGRMMRQMMGAIAEFQRSEMLARLAQCKTAAKAKKGTYGGGTVAYGYRSVGNGELAPDSGTIHLVRRCHELRAQGSTYRTVATHLNAEGFRTRKGTAIQMEQVRRIVQRELVYTGKKNVGNVPLDPGVKPRQPPILEEKQQMHAQNPA